MKIQPGAYSPCQKNLVIAFPSKEEMEGFLNTVRKYIAVAKAFAQEETTPEE